MALFESLYQGAFVEGLVFRRGELAPRMGYPQDILPHAAEDPEQDIVDLDDGKGAQVGNGNTT
jgi:hypothetical protein